MAATLQIPDELSNVLGKNKSAAAKWAALSPSHQREYVKWIAEAKKPETRAARAKKALEMISDTVR